MLLKFAFKDFMEDRELKNLFPVTVEDYKRTLDEFHVFYVDNEVVNVEEVMLKDI